MSGIEVEGPDGAIHEFPEGTTPDVIKGVLAKRYGTASQPSVAGDVAKSGAIGLAKGAIGLPGAPGDIADLTGNGAEWLIRKGLDFFGAKSPSGGKFSADYGDIAKENRQLSEGSRVLPRSDEIQKGVEAVTGPFYKPQTTAGKYAETVGSFVPAAAMGGVSPGNIARGAILPGVASEAAGQATEGTAYEPWARVAGALLGFKTPSAVASSYKVAAPILEKGANGTSRFTTALMDQAFKSTPNAVDTMRALGKEAILPDAGRSFQVLAQGVASKGGEGADALTKALMSRNATAAERISGDVNSALGPYVSPGALETALENIRQNKISPMYSEIWSKNPKVAINDLDRALATHAQNEAGPALSVLEKARDTLKTGPDFATYPYQHLTPPVNPLVADQAPVAQIPFRQPAERLHNIKEAVAADAGAYERLGSSAANSANRAGTLATKEINTALENNVPGYAEANRRFAEIQGRKSAFDEGAAAFKGEGTNPTDFAAYLASLDKKATSAARIGARSQFDKAINTGPDKVAALKAALQGGDETSYAMRNLSGIFGQNASADLAKTLQREQTFRNTNSRVIGGANTASTLGGLKQIEPEAVGVMSAMTHPLKSAGQAIFGLAARNSGDITRKELGLILSSPEKAAEMAQAMTARKQLINDRASRISGAALTKAQKAALINALIEQQISKELQ